MFKYFLNWWNCLEGIRKGGLIGGCVSVSTWALRFQKAKNIPSFSLFALGFVDQDVCSQLLLKHAMPDCLMPLTLES